MSLKAIHKDYYKMNFKHLRKGLTWPLHIVYDKDDFINGKAPAFVWDELDQHFMAIYSLNQTYNLVGPPVKR